MPELQFRFMRLPAAAVTVVNVVNVVNVVTAVTAVKAAPFGVEEGAFPSLFSREMGREWNKE
jgi:hypothetical protein